MEARYVRNNILVRKSAGFFYRVALRFVLEEVYGTSSVFKRDEFRAHSFSIWISKRPHLGSILSKFPVVNYIVFLQRTIKPLNFIYSCFET